VLTRHAEGIERKRSDYLALIRKPIAKNLDVNGRIV
jgi:hypothetical protein